MLTTLHGPQCSRRLAAWLHAASLPRSMVDIAPNPACPWCHADDTNLHVLTCGPDGRGFVHQQQSMLFDSLSSKNPRSHQGLLRLMDQRLFVLGSPVPVIVQVDVQVRMNPAALFSVSSVL